jgi:hypothetical protein
MANRKNWKERCDGLSQCIIPEFAWSELKILYGLSYAVKGLNMPFVFIFL